MKYRVLAVALAALTVSGTAFAQTATTATTAATATSATTLTEQGKVSYAMGYQLGNSVVGMGETVDPNTVIAGLKDALAKKEPSVPVDQLRNAMQSMQGRVQSREKSEFDKAGASNLVESNKFLAANKAKPGVVSTASGLQYRILEAGKGARPTANSTVNLQVAGGFPLGQRDPQNAANNTPKPAQSIKLSQIDLPGMREALALMPVGSKWEITLPPQLAYPNDIRTGQPPNVAWQYEVKLISVK